MKKIKFYLANILLVICLSTSVQQSKSQQVSISFQSFYDELSPYGTWINNPSYGYVWQPHVSGFRPYSTNGHWVWSDEYQWVWVSDYDWGWGPFHYGRWYQDPFNGWEWVPGYDWSPAWVSWRSGGDYYGWAPISPGFDVNFGFDNYAPPAEYWCFAPRRYITSNRIYNYCVTPRQNVTIIKNTVIINNYHGNDHRVYANGPQRAEAEQYTHHSIKTVNFHELSKPSRTTVNKDQVNIFRPKVNDDKNTARPAAVVPAENLRRDNRKGELNRTPVVTEPVKNNTVVPPTPVNGQPETKPDLRRAQENRSEQLKKEQDQPIGRQPEGNPAIKTPPVQTTPVTNPPVITPQVRNPAVRHQRDLQPNTQPNQQPNTQPNTQPVRQPVRTFDKHQQNNIPPVRTNPNNSPGRQQMNNPPVRTQPVRTDPVRTQPVRTEPVRTQQPQRTAEPVRMPPVRSEPVRLPPVKSEK